MVVIARSLALTRASNARLLRAAVAAPASITSRTPTAAAAFVQRGVFRGLRSIVTTAQVEDEPEASAHVHSHIQARLDYKKLAANLDDAIANAQKRFSDANPAMVVDLYHQQAKLRHEVNLLRAERNVNAKQLGMAKGSGLSEEEFAALRVRGQEIKKEIAACEDELADVQVRLEVEALKIPNDTHPDVPVGEEADSKIVALGGEKRQFDFTPKDHYDLATNLQLIDTQTAAKVSGSKFVYLCNEGAMLELALVHWTLSKLRARGFTVLFPPDVAHYKMVEGCGFQPRGEATQIYSIANSDLCLAATSEITLAGMKSNEILSTSALPLKYAGFSHCFRTEIGHGGRMTRGIYRIHQFSKVEMFGFTASMEQSQAFFNEMVEIQTQMYNELGIHYQIVDMATGDLGAPAYRKFDILAWMPGRDEYGEISSMSMCTDYQARRLNIRHKQRKEDPTEFVHTLNGTACAVPRLLISILETYQQKDGSVVIPEVLRPYMGMQEVILPPATSA
uniref:serine--tRNA ligase n=1 Tax=Globisporangium ultimum (strain ATCC 200006 / CBS 805.95 / DAOM BR144) TaxID=431595 RepID=K3X3N2_GLOUD